MTDSVIALTRADPTTENSTMDLPARQFADFVRSRTPALLRSAYLLTGDRHLAEDLVQSALARTHRAWRRLHQDRNAEAYARKTMYHLQVDWWRRKRVAESFPGTLPEPRGGPNTDDATSLRLAVRAALLRLAPRQRAVLVLRYFEQHTIEETAKVLSVSPGTVKSQTAKALNRLRVLAPELGDIDDTAERTRS